MPLQAGTRTVVLGVAVSIAALIAVASVGFDSIVAVAVSCGPSGVICVRSTHGPY